MPKSNLERAVSLNSLKHIIWLDSRSLDFDCEKLFQLTVRKPTHDSQRKQRLAVQGRGNSPAFERTRSGLRPQGVIKVRPGAVSFPVSTQNWRKAKIKRRGQQQSFWVSFDLTLVVRKERIHILKFTWKFYSNCYLFFSSTVDWCINISFPWILDF